MTLMLVAFVAILGVVCQTDKTPKMVPPPANNQEFILEVERVGAMLGCYPRDYMSTSEWRFVLYICPIPNPPQAVLFRDDEGKWRGVRAIFPDFASEYLL